MLDLVDQAGDLCAVDVLEVLLERLTSDISYLDFLAGHREFVVE